MLKKNISTYLSYIHLWSRFFFPSLCKLTCLWEVLLDLLNKELMVSLIQFCCTWNVHSVTTFLFSLPLSLVWTYPLNKTAFTTDVICRVFLIASVVGWIVLWCSSLTPGTCLCNLIWMKSLVDVIKLRYCAMFLCVCVPTKFICSRPNL